MAFEALARSLFFLSLVLNANKFHLVMHLELGFQHLP